MRTTIDLADNWEEAAKELGTRGKTETVNRALEEIIARRQRRAAIDTFRSLELELDTDTMDQAWR
ncbi:MAG: type II toxin-antitoxin system VapB family antitoxin [Sciscionella sp.]|nr:type II toxin-antitoxin system VapB family antitoxin [Sciscionella sp.]